MTNYQESARPDSSPDNVRAVIQATGNVQGVGFRPFLYRLAVQNGLTGYVANSPAGVEIEVEGLRADVERFLAGIQRTPPPLARVDEVMHRFLAPVGYSRFLISPSRTEGPNTTFISPDITVCDDCLGELFEPQNRRFLFPFINCTNCGPRYTIINGVPYDRDATSMSCFTMCSACRAEYTNPDDRRFHAEPNGCPECGPQIWLETCNSVTRQHVIDETVELIQKGAVVAVKGLGGFHLACDANNRQAIETLRRRKKRDEKPFPLLVADIDTAREFSRLDDDSVAILTSRPRPIVLLKRQGNAPIADAVAPNSNRVGVMLPYTPLHHLLMFDASRRRRFPALVMTSGNLSDEPIAIGNREARRNLEQIADAFLFHDRDILVRADDSVIRHDSLVSRESSKAFTTMIRRSRGYVPRPVFLHRELPPILALGGQQKNTIGVSRGREAYISQHIGELDSLKSWKCLEESVERLQRILGVRPQVVAHDMHPDYLSTRFARGLDDVKLVAVQHHHAHVASCMAEHGLEGPVIGVALDGTGYGTDGGVWGGEILIADYDQVQRAGHFHELPMPGGEQAIKQPWRMAVSFLDATFADDFWDLPIPFVRSLDQAKTKLLLNAARRGINSPQTSSCGRIFDAVAALCGLTQIVSYEGQAALELESMIDISQAQHVQFDRSKSFVSETPGDPIVVDTRRLIEEVVGELMSSEPAGVVSLRFHQRLALALTQAICSVAHSSGLEQVVLSGGCFQNHFLVSELTRLLELNDLAVFCHHQVPPNDGGLALGQLMIASAS